MMLSAKQVEPMTTSAKHDNPHLVGLDPLLRDFEAAEMLYISKPTFWKRVTEGFIPRPLKFGKASRWPKSEILAVIEKAKAARNVAA